MGSQVYRYKSVEMAKYIVAYGNDNGYLMNMTKTQKLLYIAYGIFLAIERKRLCDEHPKAWPFGPVFPITREALLKIPMYALKTTDKEFANIRQDKNIQELLELVFGTFGNWTAQELSQWSHSEGSPWDLTVTENNDKWNKEISDNYIHSYFSSILKPIDTGQQ